MASSHWQENMITVVNCFMINSVFWMHFLTSSLAMNLSGRALFQYHKEVLFGLNIHQSFLLVSILVSVFAMVSVILWAHRAAFLWKRVLLVSIFSSIAIGFSCLMVKMEEWSYQHAKSVLELSIQRDAELQEQPHYSPDNYYKSSMEIYDALIKEY